MAASVGLRSRPAEVEAGTVLAVVLHTGPVAEVHHTVLAVEARRTVPAEVALHIDLEEVLRTDLEEVRHTVQVVVADTALEEGHRNLAEEEVRHTGLEVEHRTDLAGAHRIALLVAAADPSLAVAGSRPAVEDTAGSALAVDSSPAVVVAARTLEAGLGLGMEVADSHLVGCNCATWSSYVGSLQRTGILVVSL